MPVPIRIPSRALRHARDGWTWGSRSSLHQRDESPPTFSSTAVVTAAVVIGLVVLITAAIVLRRIRSRHSNPKYIPTPFLKRLWTKWEVPNHRGGYQPAHNNDSSSRRTARMRQAQDAPGGQATENRQGAAGRGSSWVDRSTSIRSVMTLPAYQPKPGDTEQVLGREGERDGIDVVLELPTAEDEEGLRDDEMEALYQIRVARRRQIAERDNLREERREARQRHDSVALDELRQRGRNASQSNTEEVEELRREHERIKDSRNRAVSSVSYGELGVARADGTRLRANSTESERVGLLSDAASIALSTRSQTGTGASSLLDRRHRRSSSIMSIDTTPSNDRAESPALVTGDSTYSLRSAGRSRSRANSEANTPRQGSNTRAGSSPEIVNAEEGDLGDTELPPPGYDDVNLDEITPVHSRDSRSGRNSPYADPPPNYPGPSQARNNRLSAHMEDLAAEAATEEGDLGRRSSRASLPRLPSLRLDALPQIVVEPSSARPRDHSGERL